MARRRIILRREIPSDLEEIVTYLDAHSTSAGDRFLDAAFTAFDDLAERPGKGSPKRFRNPRFRDIRSWWVPGFRKYLIFYQPSDEAIVILGVVHGTRDVRALLRKRI
jgi:toxin ParE1/3/4